MSDNEDQRQSEQTWDDRAFQRLLDFLPHLKILLEEYPDEFRKKVLSFGFPKSFIDKKLCVHRTDFSQPAKDVPTDSPRRMEVHDDYWSAAYKMQNARSAHRQQYRRWSTTGRYLRSRSGEEVLAFRGSKSVRTSHRFFE